MNVAAQTSRNMASPLCTGPCIAGVLDLHPAQAPAGPVAARRPLRDDAFEAHAAGVAEHGLAVRAGQVVAEDDRDVGTLEVLPEHRPALDEGEPAEVVGADVQEVEGVKARSRA